MAVEESVGVIVIDPVGDGRRVPVMARLDSRGVARGQIAEPDEIVKLLVEMLDLVIQQAVDNQGS